jgi:two-component system sensor histidine kinase KdpD
MEPLNVDPNAPGPSQHILVCVGPSPASARLVRRAKRMADQLQCRWTAVTVEVSERDEGHPRLARHLRLAERLGAEVAVLHGVPLGSILLEFARRHHVTRIVMGKPTHARWRDFVFGSVLDDVARASGDIEVHVVAGEEEETPGEAEESSSKPLQLRSYLHAVLAVGMATSIGLLLRPHVELGEVAMLYLLAIGAAAVRSGRNRAIFASILAAGCFDYVFVPPRFSFAVDEIRHVLTFVTMFGTGLVIGTLADRVRMQTKSAERRERRTAALYALTRDLLGARDASEISSAAVRHLIAYTGSQVALLLPDPVRNLTVSSGTATWLDAKERAVAAWTFAHDTRAGATTDRSGAARALYLPLRASGGTVGVMAVRIESDDHMREPEQQQLLEMFGKQIATALERVASVEAHETDREPVIRPGAIGRDAHEPLVQG